MSSKSRFRIAFIVGSFPKLSETFILNQIIALVREGHEVEIFPSLGNRDETIHPDVSKYNLLNKTYLPPHLPKNKLLAKMKCLWLITKNFGKIEIISKILSISAPPEEKIALFFHMLPFLGKNKFDVVHCHFGPTGIRAAYARSFGLFDGKMVLSFYGYDVTRKTFDKDFYQGFINEFGGFITFSQFLKVKLLELGFPDEKTKILPLIGVDLEKFKAERVEKDTEKITLLTVGRLVEKKGIYYSLLAFNEIKSRYPGLEYIIIGSGPLYENLHGLITEMGLNDKVSLRGDMDMEQVKTHYLQSDIFVLSSITASDGNSEGQPSVLKEAQAMELPVVSTLHQGIQEAVMDGVTGFLVPEKDIKAIAEKISFLIENPTIRSEMGKKGRLFVTENYNNKHLGKILLDYYKEIMKQ